MKFINAALLALSLMLPLMPGTAMAGFTREIPLEKQWSDGYSSSVSASGDVFSIALANGVGSFVRVGERDISLDALLADALYTTNNLRSIRVKVNPDGHFLLIFSGTKLAIHSLPGLQLVWTGTVDARGSLQNWGSAFFYRQEDRRLFVVGPTSLIPYTLQVGADAVQERGTQITFEDEGRKLSMLSFSNRNAAFSPNGRSVYVGTEDGEVVSIDLSGTTPKLRWRTKVFEGYRVGEFQDNGRVSELVCAENCTRLVVEGFRQLQVGIVNASSGQLVGIASERQYVHLVPIGGRQYIITRSPRGSEPSSMGIVDENLRTIRDFGKTETSLIFGFNGGFVQKRLGDPQVLEIVDIEAKLNAPKRQAEALEAERKRQIEAQETERKRQIEAEAAAAKNVRSQQLALEKQLPSFRKQLKSGSDSHCGLVVERKGDIAFIETMIGQKWLKVSQLYPPNTKGCQFFNGVYQD